MFTGLVETLGEVEAITPAGPGRRLTIAAPALVEGLKLGDSVAINGACLTVVKLHGGQMDFEAGTETLARTNLGELSRGSRVNLERALALGDRLGGHLVQGHVDGLGRIARRQREGDWDFLWIDCPPVLAEQMVPKGSIAVDGVSLTLVEVTAESFSVMLIPHTQAVTTLGFKGPGDTVNLETDLLAKYVWKCLRGSGVTLEVLKKAGLVQDR